MIPRLLILALISLAVARGADAAERSAGKSGDDAGVVFRKPFTLRIRVDQKHYYEEKKGRIPYVHRGDVYLFIGDRFGLKIDVADGAVRTVRYERDLSKADITLEFREADPVNGKYTSMLKMENRTRHTFLMDGGMTVPDARTSSRPASLQFARACSITRGGRIRSFSWHSATSDWRSDVRT
jgi:hypothetical protein